MNPARLLAIVLLFTTGVRAQEAGATRHAGGVLQATADTGRSIVLELPPSLARERRAYEREVAWAMNEVLNFFRVSGLEVPAGGTIESVLVFESTTGAREHLADTYGISPGDIPQTFSGTVDGARLFLVSRESYEGTWKKLYRDWPWTDTTYRGLIVHELAHRAHEAIAVARHGTPEAMGPTWFFEGLAITCAGQFRTAGPPMSAVDIIRAVGSGRTPESSYPLYGRLVRSLAATFPVRDLIDNASDKKFPELLWPDPPTPPGGDKR